VGENNNSNQRIDTELPWTGERYIPYSDLNITGGEIHYEHLHRCTYATYFVKSKKSISVMER